MRRTIARLSLGLVCLCLGCSKESPPSAPRSAASAPQVTAVPAIGPAVDVTPGSEEVRSPWQPERSPLPRLDVPDAIIDRGLEVSSTESAPTFPPAPPLADVAPLPPAPSPGPAAAKPPLQDDDSEFTTRSVTPRIAYGSQAPAAPIRTTLPPAAADNDFMPNPLRSSSLGSLASGAPRYSPPPSGGSTPPSEPSGGSAPPLADAPVLSDAPAFTDPPSVEASSAGPPVAADAPTAPELPSTLRPNVYPDSLPPLGVGSPPDSDDQLHAELDARRAERRAAIEAVLAERARQDGSAKAAAQADSSIAIPAASQADAPLETQLPEGAAGLLEPIAKPTHEKLFPVAPDGSETVTVFYGTDRNLIRKAGDSLRTVLLRFSPMLVIGAAALFFGIIAVAIGRRVVWLLFAGSTAAALAFGLFAAVVTWRALDVTSQGGVEYGNERGTLQMGMCEVAIPPHHETGKLESPSILKLEIREDARKHVMLKKIEPLLDEAFYERLQAQVERSPQKEVFIFIHGYNNTFEDAIRRTGQMAHDLEYLGAAVCYSWPSQGGLFQYTVDETNVAWTAPHFKRFVLDIVAHSNARHVSLIAHSMGNRALTSALRDIAIEMRDAPTMFQQVVLAAPDIDADIFVRDIAPVLKEKAESVTLYASSNDQALIASKLVHGYPRAGDSGELLVLMPGIDTIDVSQVDTSLLGHNYYGESDAILADICLLLQESKPPSQRSWLTPMAQNGLTYWVLQSAQAAAWVRTRPHATR